MQRRWRGIFATLEQGGPDAPPGFERVFGTPTGAAIAALAEGVGAAYERVSDPAALAEIIGRPPRGITVVEVVTSRADRAAEASALVAAVRAAV